MGKSRLTLLLNEDQIRKLKVDAAANGMPVNQWVVENLLSDDVMVLRKLICTLEAMKVDVVKVLEMEVKRKGAFAPFATIAPKNEK